MKKIIWGIIPCEHCIGAGTVEKTINYKIKTVKCTYCNGTGIYNK